MIKKDFALKVDDIPIAGELYIPGTELPYPVVCICHGIPYGIPAKPGDEGYPALAERICGEGFAVCIFNFRGAGNSGGNFDILGWTRDLRAVIDYLYGLKEVDKTRLALLGFSGGAAVSVCVAAQDSRVSCVVACACPAEFTFITEADNIQSVVDHFRKIGTIRDAGFPESVDDWVENFHKVYPLAYVMGIAPRSLLIVHGKEDTTVDVNQAYRMFEKALEPKWLFILDGAGHRLRQEESVMSEVISWLKSQYAS